MNLTPSEQRTIAGVFAGYTNAEIAKDCGISLGTVKNQLRSAYQKLGIAHVRQLFPLVIASHFEQRTGQILELQP